VGGSITYLTTKEYYKIVEAWGGWNIGKKFRLMASLPYSFNERSNQGITKEKKGLGDITVSGYFQVLNTRKTVLNNKLLVQSFLLGGGIKLNTGDYNPLDKSTSNSSANLFQLGTGSIDYLMGGMYDIRLQDAGISSSASYKVNTANKFGYKYGNKLNLNIQAYYKFRIKDKIGIAPNAGFQYEKAQIDLDRNFDVTVSGGNILLGTLGVETAFKKISIGANFQKPISQELASGIVNAKERIMVHIAIML
jgi:hypothetical protein